ncbi:hypothetical protein QWY28_06240 [Nocardioides sp. SOB77]|uniref:Uncharacterized protein n=1 Tax=Nocardioides oceani TaxID=3058369 RepID=A0ABT8FDK5_9ACTN|nr:hypothetical protein [Nocardioides oceani]MDN4172535.1 hypothetical protein [Nocardioides oceani]
MPASTADLGTGALAGRRATYATDPAEAVGPEVRLVDQQPVEVVLRVDGDTWSGTTGGGSATTRRSRGPGSTSPTSGSGVPAPAASPTGPPG